MNNSEIKQEAKELIRTSKPSIIGTSLIYLIVLIVFSYLQTKLAGFDMSESEMAKYYGMISAQQFDAATDYALQFMPEKAAMALSTVISLVKGIVDAGFLIFLLHSIRKTGEACYGNLLDGFSVGLKFVLMTILKCLFIGLLFCLLIVPGVIALYQYRQSTYLLIDHPDWGVTRCLHESKVMMKGRKWQLFSLDMSFLGWYILSAIPVVDIWVTPYTKTAYSLFYNKLANPDVYTGTEI